MSARASAPVDAAVALPAPRPSWISGEWERQSEPYRGMRIAFRDGETTVKVTRSSTVDATAKNKAQLECQRSLWSPGDTFITDFHWTKGTIIVRDWGLTAGVCRHHDAKAPAEIIGEDEGALLLMVGRGKTPVAQSWTRVR